MVLLIVGLVIFFGIHLLPSLPLRHALVAGVGEQKYKGLFSLAAFVGLGLIIYGYSQTEFVAFLAPQPWGRSAAFALMPLAIIFIMASDIPNNLKRFVRHPMLIGITVWSATHIAANGDLASTLLFACFGSFAILDIILVESGRRYVPAAPVHPKWDAILVIGGLLVTALLIYFHEYFTGMPLM